MIKRKIVKNVVYNFLKQKWILCNYFLCIDICIRYITNRYVQLLDKYLTRYFVYPNLQFRFWVRSEEHTSELQSPCNLVCRLLLEKKKNNNIHTTHANIPLPSHYSLDTRTIIFGATVMHVSQPLLYSPVASYDTLR